MAMARPAFQPFRLLSNRPSLRQLQCGQLISTRPIFTSFNLNSPPKQEKENVDKNYDEQDLNRARKWIKESRVHSKLPKIFPPSIGEVTFSRSSGPGGQNVNKVNTKATLRVPLASLEPLIPRIFFQALKTKGSKYLTDAGDMVISSDGCRSQLTNTNTCWLKLYNAVVNSARVPGKTSQEKKEHVQKLIQISDGKRKDMKSKLSQKKSSRRGPVGEW
ncbi:hypothetical protein TWF481_007124 [Arthrobotrys musiformis]|uniref:Prokaryotic-type class I peptide chain release factors domain-containing protein n=1 Tax=Arthrobotrys musiformis TaxID=47236 RepID=A0AAV9WCF5_9PEZI